MSNRNLKSEAPSLSVLACLAALGALLIAFQYTTLSKFGVIAPGRRFRDLDALMAEIARKVDLTVYDHLLALLILLLFVGLALSHILKGSLTGLVKWCLASDRRAILALTVITSISVRFYFSSGEITWGADSAPHRAYAWIASHSIPEGELPIWTNYFGTGSPFCQFYGFLFYYLTGLVHLVIRDVTASLKFVMAAGHIVSGLSMFFLAHPTDTDHGPIPRIVDLRVSPVAIRFHVATQEERSLGVARYRAGCLFAFCDHIYPPGLRALLNRVSLSVWDRRSVGGKAPGKTVAGDPFRSPCSAGHGIGSVSLAPNDG
jgi:hypothetical protein